MTTIQITKGSEKQNDWATQIANKWITKFNIQISANDLRPVSDNVSWYSDSLRFVRDSLIADISKMTAKQIIDNRNSDPASRCLQQMRNASESRLREFADKYNTCALGDA